jgi:hypothetical protein
VPIAPKPPAPDSLIDARPARDGCWRPLPDQAGESETPPAPDCDSDSLWMMPCAQSAPARSELGGSLGPPLAPPLLLLPEGLEGRAGGWRPLPVRGMVKLRLQLRGGLLGRGFDSWQRAGDPSSSLKRRKTPVYVLGSAPP